MSKQEKLRKQNKQLKSVVDGYMEQIERLKKSNEQHQAQIETLLKFNQRLLVIIETELSSYNKKKSDRLSLQPISEITQKDSEAFQPIGSMKAEILNSIKLAELQAKDEDRQKKSGNETDRVMLGENLSDALSYEISRSDYQRQYSEYSKKQKVNQVMALINAYKQEYGQSNREYDEINTKMREDVKRDNLQIQNLNTESSSFYGNKLEQLTSLKEKIKDNTPQKQLQKIIDGHKYSASTQNKLMKIMSTIK